MRIPKDVQKAIADLADGKPRRPEPRRRKPPKPKEADVQGTILQWLELRRIYAIRINSGNVMIRGQDRKVQRVIRLAPEDTADIIGELPGGRFLAIEVKKPGEMPDRGQIDWLRARNAAGGFACWTDNLPDAIRLVNHALAGGSVRVGMYGTQTLS